MLTTESALRKDRTTGLSTMEHRHFATVATIICTYPGNRDQLTTIARHFACELARTNPRFDRERFLRACGV